MSAPVIRTLVVDDEQPARDGLHAVLARLDGFEVVGEAASGRQAVDAIREHTPDLVLLDVEMPDFNGLDVVSAIGPERMPAVIFVTAYDHYAVAAFDTSAIDYVLKPVVNERLERALDRARRAILADDDQRPARADSLRGMMAGLTGMEFMPQEQRFTLRVGDTIRVFRIDEIDWVEADEYYVKLHIAGQSYMLRQSMSVLEDRLPGDRFLRIHRSTIVNLDRIEALEPMFRGDFEVVLEDGTRLRMSRRRRELLERHFHSLS